MELGRRHRQQSLSSAQRLRPHVASGPMTCRKFLLKHYWVTSKTMQVLRRRPRSNTATTSTKTNSMCSPRSSLIGCRTGFENRGGYLIGNIRTGRPDFRFYSLGNSLGCHLRTAHGPTTTCTCFGSCTSQPRSPDGSDADANLPSTQWEGWSGSTRPDPTLRTGRGATTTVAIGPACSGFSGPRSSSMSGVHPNADVLLMSADDQHSSTSATGAISTNSRSNSGLNISTAPRALGWDSNHAPFRRGPSWDSS